MTKLTGLGLGIRDHSSLCTPLPWPTQNYALLPKGLQRIDAVALEGPSAATGDGPPPLPASEVVLPELQDWAGAAGEAGVVEGTQAGVDGGEAVAVTGS